MPVTLALVLAVSAGEILAGHRRRGRWLLGAYGIALGLAILTRYAWTMPGLAREGARPIAPLADPWRLDTALRVALALSLLVTRAASGAALACAVAALVATALVARRGARAASRGSASGDTRWPSPRCRWPASPPSARAGLARRKLRGLSDADHAAGQPAAGIAGGLRLQVVGLVVDDHARPTTVLRASSAMPRVDVTPAWPRRPRPPRCSRGRPRAGSRPWGAPWGSPSG